MDAKKLSLVAIPALLALPGLSAAQATVEKPWSFKVGVSSWLDSDVRDVANNTAFSFGLGYQLPGPGFLSREFGRSYIEADWLGSASNGSRVNSFGLWYVERAPFSPPVAGQGMFYGGLGVGLAFNSARVEGTGGGNGGGGNGGGSSGGGQARPLSLERGFNDETYRSTRVGLLALLGYEFQQNFFVEAQFRWSGAIEGSRTDSLGLMVGFRF